MSRKILVGSSVFFNEIEGFHPKDRDYVLLVSNPVGFNYTRQTSGPFCVFEWKKMTPEEFIQYSLSKGPAMQLGKFLVPEFNKEIGFNIEHLRQLKPLVDKLDKRHKYEEIIFNSYIENNDFYLTKEQLNEAYDLYKIMKNK